jgi:ferric-chelate reductase [NAD(P)H]
MTEINLAVLNQIQYGIFIVSSFLNEKINGQIATVVFQVTNEPIQIATCLNKSNLTHQFVTASKAFGVSILSQQADLKFIGTFGFHTGHNFDKFARINYKKSVTGSPLVLDNTIGVLDLKVTKTVDINTHTLFIGSLLDSEKINDTPPLTYDYYYSVLKGKNHQHAPTFHTKTTA